MMGRRSGQIRMQIVDVEMMIPENHLLRKIDRMVRFEFIYELLTPYYPSNGRPSVDPVSMFKMLLVGYLYGIKSERRLLEEVRLNLAYRWFCGFELHEAIPDHSTFSKTRAEVAAKRSVSEGVSGNCTAMCQKRPCGWKRVNPKFCVNPIWGANRAKFICGGSRLVRLPPFQQYNTGRAPSKGSGAVEIPFQSWTKVIQSRFEFCTGQNLHNQFFV